MPIIGSNVAIITVIGIQGLEQTYNTMEYYPTVGLGEESAKDNVDGWVADISTAWLTAASESWIMLEVKVQKKIDGVWTDASKVVALPGLRPAAVLPPYNTFSFRKNPNNAAREPAGERMVGKGRIALSGVAEADQDNGILNPTAVPWIDAFAVQVSGYQSVGAVTTYQMYIQSLATIADPIEVFAPVLNVAYGRQGTQLTRKN